MRFQSGLLALLLTALLSGGAMAQQPPVQAQATLPKAALDTLVGTWSGPVAAGPGTVTFVTQFKVDDKGNLQGSFSVPEQGATGLPMSDIQFADNKLSANIQMPGGVPAQYIATFANGVFTGLFRAGNPLGPPEGVPVVLRKGEYTAPVYTLKLSAESFALLAGTWSGTLSATGPQGQMTLHLVLRFESDKHGSRVGYMDSPDQHATGIPVTEASLSAGKLFVRVETLQGEYNATLSGNSMTGEWTQLGSDIPLTMARK